MESAPDVEYWIIIFDLFHAFRGNGKEMFWWKLRQSTPDSLRKGGL